MTIQEKLKRALKKLQRVFNKKQIGNLTEEQLERAKKYKLDINTERGDMSARLLSEEQLKRAKKYHLNLETKWGFRSAYSLSEEELKLAKECNIDLETERGHTSALSFTKEQLKEALSKIGKLTKGNRYK